MITAGMAGYTPRRPAFLNHNTMSKHIQYELHLRPKPEYKAKRNTTMCVPGELEAILKRANWLLQKTSSPWLSIGIMRYDVRKEQWTTLLNLTPFNNPYLMPEPPAPTPNTQT